MIYFDSDYMAGAHPEVMESLCETNLLHTIGYGCDEYCRKARNLILEKCGIDNGEVFFFEGGTQTNATVIDALLRRNEGALCTVTAHINVHEAGAIEATGHKVLALPEHNGKLLASDVESYIDNYNHDDTREHIVAPGMVYISFPTELGTVYTREELSELKEVCSRHNIPLYIDGARMAYGLQAVGNDISLKEIASLCDAFYIGGTKCGALFGEAMVTSKPQLFPRFRSLIKQRGGMLAKGRLLGVQFLALLENNLYERIGAHAVGLAKKLKKGFTEKGIKLFIDSPTNQQFFILPNETINKLREHASFELWGSPGEKETAVRFVTDWSTKEEDIDTLLKFL